MLSRAKQPVGPATMGEAELLPFKEFKSPKKEEGGGDGMNPEVRRLGDGD